MPACVCEPAAVAGSTVMPQTGSIAVSRTGASSRLNVVGRGSLCDIGCSRRTGDSSLHKQFMPSGKSRDGLLAFDESIGLLREQSKWFRPGASGFAKIG